jgi:N-acetylmuramoyl-L-alanine amidase
MLGQAFAFDHATYGKGALLTRRQLRPLQSGFVRLLEPDKPLRQIRMRSLPLVPVMALVLCLLGLGNAFAQPPLPRHKPIDVLIAATRTAVTDARIGKNGDHTRFVLNISDNVDFEVFTLADPYRIVLDLPEVTWRLTGDGQQATGGAIRGYRYGLFRAGLSRMVIDLSGPVAIANKFLLPPEGERRYRLVLDLAPVDRAKYLASAGWPKGAQDTQAEDEPPIELDDESTRPAHAKRIVVIDAGHGGVDPGTTGYSGTYEKDVVLALAKQLRDTLMRTGRYEVVMTRDTDIFLSLRARVAVGRRAKADLFVSLHCDSAPNSSVRGASVYTLSERASDREADALARAENQSDVIAGVDLTNEPDIVTSILIDLAQRETKNNSARFAQVLLPELRSSGRIVAQTHRFAGFVVLKAPDVPSVLIEGGYLSNKDDEDAMTSARWRVDMASGIARGIDRYFALIRHGRPTAGTE